MKNVLRKAALSSVIAAALLGSMGAAQATDVGNISGSANVGGQLTTYGTQVVGSVNSQGSGNSISAAETDGFGKSIQSGSSYGGASSNIGATTNIGGLTVGASTSQWSNAQTFGSLEGNSPITVGGAIANGSASIGKGIGAAAIGGNFQQNAIGAGIGVNGDFHVSTVGE